VTSVASREQLADPRRLRPAQDAVHECGDRDAQREQADRLLLRQDEEDRRPHGQPRAAAIITGLRPSESDNHPPSSIATNWQTAAKSTNRRTSGNAKLEVLVA